QFYDVAKREHRVLMEDTGAASVYPGLSSDGKRIAVARLRRESGKAEMIVYDMMGKVLHRSPEITWRDARVGDNQQVLVPMMVFWDTAGRKIVVSEVLQPNPRSGIYDLAAKKMMLVDGQILPFGNKAFCPDDKG